MTRNEKRMLALAMLVEDVRQELADLKEQMRRPESEYFTLPDDFWAAMAEDLEEEGGEPIEPTQNGVMLAAKRMAMTMKPTRRRA